MSEDLEQRVELMRKEIDTLQVAAAEKSKPWYMNVSTLLSAIALTFSFGTTFVSYHRTNVQDVQNARSELRGLLQRLAALPKENMEAGIKYATDPGSMNVISGFINQENTLLVRNAAELAKKLPAGSVSPTEYYAIAVAFQAAYDPADAEQFVQYAMNAEPDFNIEISCLRMMANLKFIKGRPEEGRADYQKALAIFSKYPQYDPFTRAQTNVLTEISWAYSEAGGYDFAAANQHLDNAAKIVAPLPRSPGVNGLQSQIDQARAKISQGAPPPNLTPESQLPVPTASPSGN
jgi:tetratricopeptide (TPR) repeat protein